MSVRRSLQDRTFHSLGELQLLDLFGWTAIVIILRPLGHGEGCQRL
jgi:hypothetical protein